MCNVRFSICVRFKLHVQRTSPERKIMVAKICICNRILFKTLKKCSRPLIGRVFPSYLTIFGNSVYNMVIKSSTFLFQFNK